MKRKILSSLLCSSMIFAGAALPVAAQEAHVETKTNESNIAQGTIGTADWVIDSDGVLTIGEGSFSYYGNRYEAPWQQYLQNNTITRVDGSAHFVASGVLMQMFSPVYGVNTSLTSIDLSGWDTSDATEFKAMFFNLNALTSVDLSSFNTSKVEYMDSMFAGCSSLYSIDLRNFDLSHLNRDAGLNDLFKDCTDLEVVYYSGKSADLLNELPEQDGWYFDNTGPYSIANLPYITYESSAMLTRRSAAFEQISIDTAGVNNLASQYDYTGSEIVPSDLYIWVGDYLLEEGKDYYLSCRNNVEPGTATVRIIGMGDYTGYTERTFEIVGKPEPTKKDLAQNILALTYTCPQWTGSSVTLNDLCIFSIDGSRLTNQDYTVSYSNNINVGNGHYVVTGIGNYTGTYEGDFTIEPANLRTTALTCHLKEGNNDVMTWTGSPLKPKISVKLPNGKELVENKDYKLSYSSNTDPGTATVTITGIGNCCDTSTFFFQIVKSEPPAQNTPTPPSQNTPTPPASNISAPQQKLSMYRLYNPNSGEHFYTAATAEKDHLVKVGWKYEGIGWTAPKESKTPVYRLYNANAGDHHYTLDTNEKDTLVKVGWKYEGIG